MAETVRDDSVDKLKGLVARLVLENAMFIAIARGKMVGQARNCKIGGLVWEKFDV